MYGCKPEEILVLPIDMEKTDDHPEAVEVVLKYFKKVNCLYLDNLQLQNHYFSCHHHAEYSYISIVLFCVHPSIRAKSSVTLSM